ncbi:MAG: hypothetical protein WDZ91_05080 [Paenibacillaceae bacterium]
MKQWRVGTLSMGIALVMLGLMLFSSQWKGLAALDTFLTWWPLVFVLLGLELLIYLAVSRLSNPVVKYDIFSVIFVGLICTVCIGFVVLASTGLMQEIRHEISSVERTEDIPSIDEKLQSQVKKVVVQNLNWSEILVDQSLQSSDQAVHVFGTYRYSSSEGEDKLKLPDSMVTVRTIGDTMYVSIEQPPRLR